MCRPVPPSEMAHLMRRHLRIGFPGAEFTVTVLAERDTFPVGVEWEDGPAAYAVFGAVAVFDMTVGDANGRAVPAAAWSCPEHGVSAGVNQFGPLDGCCDGAESVRFPVQVHLHRHLSPEFNQELSEAVARRYGLVVCDGETVVPGFPPGTTLRGLVKELSCGRGGVGWNAPRT